MASPKRRERGARDCDVRLQVSGDSVQAVPVIRHLINALGVAWCGEDGDTTDTPAKATCRKCFAARLKEMQRQARLRGDFWLLGEREQDEYDHPFERMSAAQVVSPSESLAELTAGVRTKRARRGSKAMPGSAAKQDILANRVARGESTSHGSDRNLEYVAEALQVENARNGSTRILGVITLTGPDAQATHQEQAARIASDALRERAPGVWAWLSGEGVLRRLERQLGRRLHAAARALAAWPWGMHYFG